MTAQAKFRGASGLAHFCFERAAAIRRIRGCGHLVVPERHLADGGVWSMTKHADFGFGAGPNVPWTAGRKVVFRMYDAVWIVRCTRTPVTEQKAARSD